MQSLADAFLTRRGQDREMRRGKKTKCWYLTKPMLVQELKGNIRVFCRVRPLVAHDALTQSAAVDQLLQFPSSGAATHSARKNKNKESLRISMIITGAS